MNKIAVIGGGAAGMIAAITAQRLGCQVSLYEKNTRVGKKLLATGNGRCNYTNTGACSDDYHSGKANFVYHALQQFSAAAAIDFFKALGIEPKYENDGKVYPRSEQASSILDVLRHEVNRLGVKLYTEIALDNIVIGETGFLLNQNHSYDAVIIATGGKAMPASGCTGDGYAIAKRFGHNIIEPKPALVQLKLAGNFFKAISGVKLDSQVTLYHKGRVLAVEQGDLLFTDYGISGPPVLQLSRIAAHYNNGLTVALNLYSDYSVDELRAIISARRQLDKTIADSLTGLVNKRLSGVILKQCQIDGKAQASTLSDTAIDKLTSALSDWRIPITGSKGWQSAQVTVGGVDTSEVSPNDLQSNFIPGLYFCGEVLDVDGRCGGYNLQWAWASGYLAGKQAAGE